MARMNEASRQMVRQGLARAVAAAQPVFQARVQDLTMETRIMATQCAEEIRACLLEQAEATRPGAGVQETLVRLIFGHSDPDLVKVLREYAEVLNFFLMDARDEASAVQGRKGS